MFMSETKAAANHREIIFHHDDETPLDFILELLHSVFKKPLADAFRFTSAIREEGKASCGSYARDIAGEMLKAARQRIDDAGHPLRITSKATFADSLVFDNRCKLCGGSFPNRISLKGIVAFVCDDCVKGITSHLPEVASDNLRLPDAGLAFCRHSNGSAGYDLAAVPRPYAR
jgi:ATP-dependent Clp protease adapter protein ClpS